MKHLPPGDRPKSKRTWLIPLGAGLIIVPACFAWFSGILRDSRSVEERLAEIEATRTIPASENAAAIYNDLLTNLSATSMQWPESVSREDNRRALRHPWPANDIPELAHWIAERGHIIDQLIEASRFEKCRFPIILDLQDEAQKERMGSMLQWGCLLACAANNDLAESRVETALLKWRCLVQLGNHQRQQPLLLDHLYAKVTGRYALESIARYVVEGNPTESEFQAIEAMPLPINRDLAMHGREIDAILALSNEEYLQSLDTVDRLKTRYYRFRVARQVKRTRGSTSQDHDRDDGICSWCLEYISAARGMRILIAIKRHKNTTGCWPASLDRIQSPLPREMLIDPLNDAIYVYELTANSFRLYSTGLNARDEGGRHRWDGPDDWPIWPPRRRVNQPKQQDPNNVQFEE